MTAIVAGLCFLLSVVWWVGSFMPGVDRLQIDRNAALWMIAAAIWWRMI